MPPVIWRRSAILQSAAASRVDLIFSVTVSTAERIATRGSAIPRAVYQVDRVLDDVALIRQRGVDVDRGVRDEERPRVAGCVNRKDVAYAPGGAQPAIIAIDYGMHELIRMERAFHQRFDFAGAGHGDGLRRRGVAVLRRNDLVRL